MAKNHSDLIRELQSALDTLSSQMRVREGDRERLLNDQLRIQNDVHELRVKIAVLEESLGEFKRRSEESERRRWMVLVAFVGSLLALANGLVLLFVRR
jgi:hypothetical protein